MENGSKKKKGLTRSSTEHSISSINSVSTSTPFSSILSPFAEETHSLVNYNEPSLLTRTADKKIQTKEEEKKGAKKETRKRYNIDFLLARSTVDESKKLPKNWKELNLMYPNICFVGTVLSYFNASKYYDHWIKLQNENSELHNPIRTISNIQYLNLNQDNNNNTNNINRSQNVDFMNREYLSLNNFNENNKSSFNKINSSKSKNSLRFTTTTTQQAKQDFKLNNKLASKNQTKQQFCAT